MVSAPITRCRLCGGSDLPLRLDLGVLAVSTFPQTSADTLTFAPLALVECAHCRLVQLSDTVDPARLFQDQYWYASGINGTMREELRNVVREARGWVKVQDGDWVLDIGANDGTLLNAWREHLWEGRPYRVAVEPSPTFQGPLGEAAEVVFRGLFPACVDHKNLGTTKFKVITSIAMFYAVDDPVGFATAVRTLLTDDGVWIVQMQDLRNMVRATAVDNICHEHLAYYDVRTFWEVCGRAGLRIVSYSPREINGGSLRFVCMKDHAAEENFCPAIPAGDRGPVDWESFRVRIDTRVGQLQDVVAAARDAGHVVDLLGASTKGNTLLQLAGLGPAQIRQCWERHPGKVGRRTITGVPIVHETVGRADMPQLLVCPIWQFREALIERERDYLAGGGRIYFPLPNGELYFGTDAGIKSVERIEL